LPHSEALSPRVATQSTLDGSKPGVAIDPIAEATIEMGAKYFLAMPRSGSKRALWPLGEA